MIARTGNGLSGSSLLVLPGVSIGQGRQVPTRCDIERVSGNVVSRPRHDIRVGGGELGPWQHRQLSYGEPANSTTTRAERGQQEIIPARRTYAAFSAASEPRGLKRLFQPSGLVLILSLFPRIRRG